jgi:hypothetical protein
LIAFDGEKVMELGTKINGVQVSTMGKTIRKVEDPSDYINFLKTDTSAAKKIATLVNRYKTALNAGSQ